MNVEQNIDVFSLYDRAKREWTKPARALAAPVGTGLLGELMPMHAPVARPPGGPGRVDP